MSELIMFTSNGWWYPVEALAFPSFSQQAKDHGELNPHVIRVEDESGAILWERKDH